MVYFHPLNRAQDSVLEGKQRLSEKGLLFLPLLKTHSLLIKRCLFLLVTNKKISFGSLILQPCLQILALKPKMHSHLQRKMNKDLQISCYLIKKIRGMVIYFRHQEVCLENIKRKVDNPKKKNNFSRKRIFFLK